MAAKNQSQPLGIIFRKTKYRLSCKKDLQRYDLQNTQLQKNEKSIALAIGFSFW